MRLEVSEDRDPDAVPENVDGCLHTFSERSGDKTGHKSHCARLTIAALGSSPLTQDLSCYDLRCYNVGMLILLRTIPRPRGARSAAARDQSAAVSGVVETVPHLGDRFGGASRVGFTDRRVGHGGRHHRPRWEVT